MAKLTKMTVTYATKMSMDYQSVEGGAAVELEVGEDENAAKVYKRAHGKLRAFVDQEVQNALLDQCSKMEKLDRKAC